MRRFFLTVASIGFALSPNAVAQSIEVGELGSAALYDVGILDGANGGLDTNLWQATDATRATYLLETAPVKDANPLVRHILRKVVLSGGVPPSANNEEEATRYARARLKTILDLGEMGAAQTIIGRTPALADDQELQADMALMAGDNIAACGIADTVIDGRGAPGWARLRAFCHVQRGEIPAAELTMDVLKSSDYDDPAYFSLMNFIIGRGGQPDLGQLRSDDAMHVALMAHAALEWPRKTQSRILAARRALNGTAAPGERLSALYAAGPALSDQQMEQVLSSLASTDSDTSGGPVIPLDEAMNAAFPEGTGQLYRISKFGMTADRPKAIAEILRRADKASAFNRFANLLAPTLQTIPPEARALTNTKIFTRAAMELGDIPALQGIHRTLADKPGSQARIALIADALGNGFVNGPLGLDIETRLTLKGDARKGAERDTFIALAMGATLSGVDGDVIATLGRSKGLRVNVSQGVAIETAARSNARAETALWAAHILAKGYHDNESLYRVIVALNQAGLSDIAGRIAAEDFLTGLE